MTLFTYHVKLRDAPACFGVLQANSGAEARTYLMRYFKTANLEVVDFKVRGVSNSKFHLETVDDDSV